MEAVVQEATGVNVVNLHHDISVINDCTHFGAITQPQAAACCLLQADG
ncbi:MAG: hypothetical protein O2856_20270 [Planctomycetota bacterium]|nr:hypothetical protein [Planctomycetota bacterium]